jgi:uncharacterized protein DUF3313
MKRLFSVHHLTAMMGVCLGLVVAAMPAMAAKPAAPQVSEDGLQLIKQTKTRLIYKRPDANFTQFKKVAIADCAVDFSKSWVKEYNSSQRDLSRRITDKDLDRARTYLSAQFKKIFTEELGSEGSYQIAEQAAPDVLMLKPAMVNIQVSAPDLMAPARNAYYVQESGQMTLYLELWDPLNNTILGRIVDARASNETRSQRANAVTNKMAADTIMESWAKELHERLDIITGKSGTK